MAAGSDESYTIRPRSPSTLFHPAAEGVGHAASRRVRLPQAVHDGGAKFGFGKELFDIGEDVEDRIVEADGGDRGWFDARPGRQRHALRRQLVVEHRTRPDFLPVVILGVDPEDRNGGYVVIARHLIGQLDRGQRLEQREERTAEEPGLLSGDDGDRARVGEQPRGVAGLRRRAATLLLPGR